MSGGRRVSRERHHPQWASPSMPGVIGQDDMHHACRTSGGIRSPGMPHIWHAAHLAHLAQPQ